MNVARIALAWALIGSAVLCGGGCKADDEGSGISNGGNPSGGTGGGGAGSSTGGASGAGGASGTSGASGTTGSGGVGAAGAGGVGAAGAGAGGSGGAGGEEDVDSGLVDSGLEDASVDPDRCATARFCETFESYTAGSPPGGDWQLQTSRGAISVVDDQHVSGARSVRFTTEQSGDSKTAFIRLSSAAVG